MADKLDSLIGFFANDLLPTGSKDPFALRRAALGVIRLITENKLRIGLKSDLGFEDNLLAFFMDRLKVQQKEKGVRHDLIDAVLSDEDDLVRLLNRVAALQNFLSTDDGENLLAGYKRASNILKIEEKKDQTRFDGNVDPSLLKDGAEKALFDQLGSAQSAANTAVSSEKFEDAMAAIAKLRAPIDAFFDDVIVNDDDADIRVNRLNLLAKIRSSLNAVADFRKVEG
jgi:glycyl-tRNA synthetase beta chain